MSSEQKPLSKWDHLKGLFGRRPARTETMMYRLHYEAGFIPLFNVDDIEQRRIEIKEVLNDIKKNLFDESKQKQIVQDVYALFFYCGDIWFRGLDDRELAHKVGCFLDNFKDVGHLDPFVPDLFEEAMQLLSLSFKAMDVTNTPPYLIESKPIISPDMGRGQPQTQLDATGMVEMQQEVQRLSELVEKYQKGEKP